MNEYYFKAYFKDMKTDILFFVPICEYNNTLEAARRMAFGDCHRYALEHNAKLLYIYYDTDMKTVLQQDIERRCNNEN